MGMRVLFVSLNLLTSVLIARILGQQDYGRFAYIVVVVTFLTTPATLGLDRLLVREVAVYALKEQWDYLSGLLRWSNATVLLTSVGIVSLVIGLTWTTNLVANPLRIPLSIALLGVPFASLSALRLATMKGFNRVSTGLGVDLVISPLLLAGIVLLAYWLWPGQLSLLAIILAKLSTMAIILVVGITLLRGIMPLQIWKAQPKYLRRQWISSALPMMVIGGIQAIHSRIDLFMLGNMQGADVVATYSAVYQGINYIGLILSSANSLIAPRIASLYAAGKTEELQGLLLWNTRLVTGLSAAVCLPLVVFSKPFLSLYGPNFTSGSTAILILCVGQLVSAGTGSVGVLLNMTGHEKSVLWSIAVSTVLNIGCNLVLIPRWGINGAALATAISLSFVNFFKVYWAHKKLGLATTFFARRSGREP